MYNYGKYMNKTNKALEKRLQPPKINKISLNDLPDRYWNAQRTKKNLEPKSS